MSEAVPLMAGSHELAFRLLIDGNLAEGASRIPVVNPANGAAFAECPVASAQQLDAAVAGALRAFPGWSALVPADRADVMLRIAQRIDETEARLSRLLALEHGKPIAEARFEVVCTAATFRYFAGLSLSEVGIEHDRSRLVRALHMPHGMVASISPWNFPLFNMASKVAPALMAGNTVVAKPSPTTPLSTLALAEAIADVVPAGVVNFIADANDLGDKITSHPDIAMISFTGSTETGRKVMKNASATLKRLTLELGGNDPAIVLDDVDVQAIARVIFDAAFANNGQVCMAIKRVYAHDAIYDELVDALAKIADGIVVGNAFEQGTQIGPVQNSIQFEKLRDYLEIAHRDGTVAAGGHVIDGRGYFIRPTIVRDISHHSRLVQEEQFGPILPIIRFSDLDEAVHAANNTNFGLSASVWSADKERARAVGACLEAGTVWINRHLDFALEIPFGGIKQSGIGLELGQLGFQEFTQIRLMVEAND